MVITKFGSCAYIDGLVQEIRNSSVLAMELRLFCANPLISDQGHYKSPCWVSHYGAFPGGDLTHFSETAQQEAPPRPQGKSDICSDKHQFDTEPLMPSQDTAKIEDNSQGLGYMT